MTFSEWQEFSRKIRARAHDLAYRITERARDIGEKELGSGRGYCFLCAHNWLGQSWMTPAENRAARKILWLERESFKPGDMANRIIERAWRKVHA